LIASYFFLDWNKRLFTKKVFVSPSSSFSANLGLNFRRFVWFTSIRFYSVDPKPTQVVFFSIHCIKRRQKFFYEIFLLTAKNGRERFFAVCLSPDLLEKELLLKTAP